MSIGAFFFAIGHTWGCACIAGSVCVAWSVAVIAPPLVTTATFGALGSTTIICVLILALGLGAFDVGFNTGLDAPTVWAYH